VFFFIENYFDFLGKKKGEGGYVFSSKLEALEVFLFLNGQSFPSPCLYSFSDCSASVEFSASSWAIATWAGETIDIDAITITTLRAKIVKTVFDSLRFILLIKVFLSK